MDLILAKTCATATNKWKMNCRAMLLIKVILNIFFLLSVFCIGLQYVFVVYNCLPYSNTNANILFFLLLLLKSSSGGMDTT